MSKYTPGPWTHDGDGNIESGGVHVASVLPANRKANAALIAAAPDLLAAARLALARIESDIESCIHTTAEGDALRAAIAKAVGT